MSGWLVLGATGALGSTMMDALARGGHAATGAARQGAEHTVDVRDLAALDHLLHAVDPTVVVNCAALVDFEACARDPGLAYAVNARPLSVIADWCVTRDRPLVQVSTDQFFHGALDPRTAHREDAPVTLRSDYARSKYAGEALALTHPGALVVRTNMAAAWPSRGKPSVVTWALEAMAAPAPIRLFDDYYCSTIDAPTLAQAIVDLVAADARGVLNVAASAVFSKAEFVEALAAAQGRRLERVERVRAADVLGPERALRVGLDVRRAEGLLGRSLPNLSQSADHFVNQWSHAHALG